MAIQWKYESQKAGVAHRELTIDENLETIARSVTPNDLTFGEARDFTKMLEVIAAYCSTYGIDKLEFRRETI